MEANPPVEVPAAQLSAEALDGIMHDFILREGTDYGAEEVDHTTKIKRVRRQLDAGEVKIVFDPDSESVTLMTLHEWIRVTGKKA